MENKNNSVLFYVPCSLGMALLEASQWELGAAVNPLRINIKTNTVL